MKRKFFILTYSVIIIVSLSLLVEAFSYVMLRFYYRLSTTEITHLMFNDPLNEETTLFASIDLDTEFIDHNVLHPYLGYVHDPNQKKEHSALDEKIEKTVYLSANQLGFIGNIPTKQLQDNEISIVILGGSVALEFFLRATEQLKIILQQSPAFQGKTIHIYSMALNGYKQPQQLFALNYALALGYKFNIVINLDGFNEIALGILENLPTNISPYYPRFWEAYSAKALTPKVIKLSGKISLLRERIQQNQRWLQHSIFQHRYVAWNLWLAYQQHKKNQIYALNQQIKQETNKEQRLTQYQVKGPQFNITDWQAQYKEMVRLWQQSSLQMWKLCDALGIHYYHFLQPNQYVVNSKDTFSDDERHLFPPNEIDYPYRNAVEIGYPLLIEAGKMMQSQGLPFTDLTQLFKLDAQTIYADACCHYNLKGYEQVATKIANTITNSTE